MRDVYESQRAELGDIQVRLNRFATKGAPVVALIDDVDRSQLRTRIAKAKQRRLNKIKRHQTQAEEEEKSALAVVVKKN